MCLCVRSEAFLGSQVELDHGVRERLGICAEVGDDLKQRPVVCTVDLLEGNFSGIVDHDERCMPEETVAEWYSSRIGGRVTGANELYPFQFDPCHVACPPVASAFHQLTDEGDDALGTVLVRSGEVDFVAEHDEPSANLDWCQDDSVGGLAVFAILFEGLENELWSSRAGEVETDDLHVW